MMHSRSENGTITIIWSLCLIFCLSNSILVFGSSHGKHLCLPDQRNALWEFKNEFYVQEFNSNGIIGDKKTEKWRNTTDCCSWDGVSCDPKTGKVVELDLGFNNLNGPLRFNSSLFRLQHLQSLDLSFNYLSGILPDSINNLKYLRDLDLRGCKLFGKFPSSLGNLSHLTNLDLSDNDFTGQLPDSMGYLNKLTELDLRSTMLSGNFPRVLLNLSSLISIDLSSNQLKGMLPSNNMSSLSKLKSFMISGNSFYGTIPSSLFTIPSLTRLDLSRNDFTGPLEIGNISSQPNLRYLYIGENSFNGPIPRSISKLVVLSDLSLSFWNTGRSINDFSIFLHLKSLTSLDLSGINLKISSTLHFPSPIAELIISSCNISEFPKFIQNQTSLQVLDISANQIEGQIPEWLWSLPELGYVNIAHNSFSGELTILPNSTISYFIGSDNQFSGEIPRSICKLVSLWTLVLSNNFSGPIPRCLENFNSSLWILHLRNNSLSGVIPEEIISDRLRSLDVGRNWLSGQLPKSLINCTRLEFLNVEDNQIKDNFPFWLSLLPYLQILVLRSNEFFGPIASPGGSMSFPNLRIFDISENRFSGVLPSDYFVGWSAMSSVVGTVYNMQMILAPGITQELYHKSVFVTNKGSNMELVGSVFKIYKTIDVSGNKFQGGIPESIALLKELIVLNMSNNAFTGHILPSLSNLSNLQSLDLSQNRLSGGIPTELGKLTFLGWMNFSYNRLEGPIPHATQIQSQNSSSFTGNPGLCGVPLQEICNREEETTQEQDEKEEEDQVFSWIAAAIGYIPGLFCGLTIGHILTSHRRYLFMRTIH